MSIDSGSLRGAKKATSTVAYTQKEYKSIDRSKEDKVQLNYSAL
ncbi:hypothetical protein DFP97_113196 [Paenibacillus prosopidis]|uniref:Uncharacterized protein n=1 Tax=Paenibacillus prosopidis TaxID=630520 RepID=A0A368VRN8_9BACL|nr:hypothetical protein DFP97_113196 [Paenibacillus prosopidis]